MDLKNIYNNPSQPGSFQGPRKLYTAAKNTRLKDIRQKDVIKFLQGESTYTLNRAVTNKFPRNRVIVEGLESQWDIDLADMNLLTANNDGNKYFLLAIDVFSRYIWVRPLKTKYAKDVIVCLESILMEGRQPQSIRTDGGKEFQNRQVKAFLSGRDVHLFSTYNETQANYAERAIKTVKSKLYRYLIGRNTLRYIDVLQDLVHSYNHTKHSSLGRPPASVNSTNESEIRFDQFLLRRRRHGDESSRQRLRFNVGDQVRISYRREAFDREYGQKWSGEVFYISQRRRRNGIPIYKLKDWNGEDIKGTFYNQQLQKVNVSDQDNFKIEKILKRRKINGKKQVFVKWLHWPRKFNQWIDEVAVTQP